MSPLLDISLRPAKPKYQKIPQSLFSPSQIIRGIKRTEHAVRWHLPIERRYQTTESFTPNRTIDLLFGHTPSLKR